MKILYLANARLPTEKAHGIQIMKMCEAFAECGAQVELVVPRRFDDRKMDLYDFYGVERTFTIRQILTIDLYIFGAFGYIIRAVSFAIAAFLYACRREGIIYSRDDIVLFALSFLGRSCFFEVHTAKTGFFTRAALRRATGAVFISLGLKEFFHSLGLYPSSLVAPDGVDLRLFPHISVSKNTLRKELFLPVGRTIIGYVGKYRTMGEEKGLRTLIRVFPRILEDDPRSFLLLVGIYDEEIQEVSRLFFEAAIPKDSYHIVPHSPQAEAVRYIRIADILVMNYPATPHYAHFMSPLKLFEYMASGVPFISTDLPSVREIVDERLAYMVPPGDPEALRFGIRGALRESGSAMARAAAARVAVEKYTWHNRAAKIIRFIDGAIRQ